MELHSYNFFNIFGDPASSQQKNSVFSTEYYFLFWNITSHVSSPSNVLTLSQAALN